MEIWKDIPSFEGLYQASNTGYIRTAPGKTTSSKRFSKRVWQVRIMKPKYRVRGNRRDAAVTLWKDGEHNDFLVSRLVAMTWVDGMSENMTVNHIDGNPENNHCSNLEWVTLADNIKKGFADGLYMNIQKPVVLTSENRSICFESMSKASRFLGKNTGYVSNCIKRNTTAKSADGEIYLVQLGGAS